jgi:membrane protease YdiL (CAAX protease family)
MLLFIVLLMISGFVRMLLPPVYRTLGYGLLGAGAGILTLWIMLRAEKQSFSSVGFVWKEHPAALFNRAAYWFTLFVTLIVGLLSLTTLSLRYEPASINLEFILIYLAILPLAWMEEIGFRSYPLIKLNRFYGVWVSQFIIAIALAYHVLNGWSVYIAFTGPFIWAFAFGIATLKSGGIAVSTGMHFALNILQNIAGMKSSKGMIFKLAFTRGTFKALVTAAERTGVLLHLGILIAALLFTAVYIKGQKHLETKMPNMKVK